MTKEAFNEVIGQGHIKRSLQLLVNNCREYGYPLPSLLLNGGSGMGKTCFARALGQALPGKFIEIDCEGKTQEDLGVIIDNCPVYSTLFLDEVHTLGTKQQELLRVLCEARSRPEDLETKTFKIQGREYKLCPITIVLATNFPHKVLGTVRNRCIQYTLGRYSLEDLKCMVGLFGERHQLIILPGATEFLANASMGLPRTF